jgi:hypothetical protein
MQKEVWLLIAKLRDAWERANSSQRFTAVAGGVFLLLLFLLSPSGGAPRFVCDNRGLSVIAGGAGDNSTAERIARAYCTGDVELAVKAMTELHGTEKLFSGAIIRLPVDKG